MAQGMVQCTNDQSRVWYHLAIQALSSLGAVKNFYFACKKWGPNVKKGTFVWAEGGALPKVGT